MLRAVLAGGQILDKSTVDLLFGHRQPAQRGQAGGAAAKVVDRHLQKAVVQVFESGARDGRVFHGHFRLWQGFEFSA